MVRPPYGLPVPFHDELGPVAAVAYDRNWPAEFDSLADLLMRLHLSDKGSIDHVGSTSVPGLAAKDVIDVQIRLSEIDKSRITERFERAGFRRRPELWNKIEATRAGPIPKLVFAPAQGTRPCNVHVRVDGTAGSRDNLLFRDFLRAEDRVRDAWGAFKTSVLQALPEADLTAYGQIKGPAWTVLMYAADAWAEKANWSPTPLVAWSGV